MTKFTGNSYYLIVRIIFALFPFILFGILIYNINPPNKIIFGFMILILLVIIYIFYLLTKLVSVEFNEDYMNINYLVLGNKKSIPYNDLIKFTCIDGQRGYHFNVIEFRDKKLSKKKIKVDRIVDSDKFNLFARWIKNKNTNMEFKITPSDSKLIIQYRKEFND